MRIQEIIFPAISVNYLALGLSLSAQLLDITLKLYLFSELKVVLFIGWLGRFDNSLTV